MKAIPVRAPLWLPAGLILASVCLSVAILLHLPADAFWITDCGNKYLVTANLVRKDYRDFSLDYPGRDIDPLLSANPISTPFSVKREGRLYSIYPPLFSFLSAPLFEIAGFRGLLLLPLLGAIATMLLVTRLARSFGLSPLRSSLAGFASFWATPCLFYSFCYWEHTLANACVLASVILLLLPVSRGNPVMFFLSGAVLGAGIGLRDELALMAIAMLISLSIERRTRGIPLVLFPAGFAAGLIPVFLFQKWAVGSAMGFHIEGYLRASRGWIFSGPLGILRERLFVSWKILAGLPSGMPMEILYAGLFLLLCGHAMRARRENGPAGTFVCLGGAILAVVSAALLLGSQDTIKALTEGNGFLMHGAVSIPALSGFLFRGDSPPSSLARLLRNIAVLYIALTCLTTHEVSTLGIHWGPRFLLPVFPMFVILAFFSLPAGNSGTVRAGEERARTHGEGSGLHRAHVLAFASLFVLSLSLQAYSLTVLEDKLATTVRIEQKLLELPEEVVVTNIWWFPQEMAPIFYEKKFFYVKTPSLFQRLRASFKERGIESFLLVTSPGEAKTPLYRSDSDLSFFNVELSRMQP